MKQTKKKKTSKKIFLARKVNVQVLVALLALVLFAGLVFAFSSEYHPAATKKIISKSSGNTAKKPLPPKPQPKVEPQNFLPYAGIRVPILMFHHIRDPKPIKDAIGRNLSVSPEKFKADLAWLNAHNYQAINIDDLPAIFSGKLRVTKKPVVITFDDGYEDNFIEAFPDLVAAGMIGNFNIITGAIGNPGYMTAGQLKAMERAGMEFGSHTVSHLDLATLTPVRQTEELMGSKTSLANLLGKEISSLCYPSGEYNALTIAIAKQCGYRLATTTKFGYADAKSSALELPRVRMTESSNFNSLFQK